MSTGTTTVRSTSDLVHAAQQGEPCAVEHLVHRYASVVWSTVRSFRLRDADAHDAVQNTWLRMIEHICTLRDAERLPAWLATTARRECLKIIRNNHRDVTSVEPAVLDCLDETAQCPERTAIEGAMNRLLWEQIADLPKPARHMLATLSRPDAPSYADFARASGMPIGSIGPTRMRYLRRLRHQLEDSGLGAQAWW